MEHRNTRDLTVQFVSSHSAFTEPVASPMTQLAMNFEGICTRTPTGPSKGTPRRKLSLGDVENNAATPILSSSISRTLSNESGYCPSPDRFGSIDSPSADFIRRPGLLRSISSPLTSRFEESAEVARKSEEQRDENNNKENEFEFVKPTLPVYRSLSTTGKRIRPTSAPPELSPGRSSYNGDSISTRFSVDEDDDGFIDYSQLEQTEDDTFMSSTVVGLMTAPLTSSIPEHDMKDDLSDHSNMTKGPSMHATIPPSGLFHPIQCDANTLGKSRRSKSLSLKRPVPPRDPSPEERKKIRGRCSSALEASWNSPLLIGVDRVTAKSPLRRSQSVVESTAKVDIAKLLTIGTDHSNLTGDLTRENILPTIKGQHEDLRTIEPKTVIEVLDNRFPAIDQLFIIDCRYPYEYEGGHIKTALNFHLKEEVYEFFLKRPKCSPEKRTVILFHCEFSSKRAPNMYRYLRNKDRDAHHQCYPKLFYPELYVIEGGYKAFFESFPAHCEPQTYRPMAHENFTQELRRFSKRSKSWSESQTVRKTYRQGLKF